MKKYLVTLFAVCACVNNVMSQWLEVKNEKEERSISIKMKDGKPSARIIVNSSVPLSYSSNMGDVTRESVGYGEANGMRSDTLYFYLTESIKRTLTIGADGYPPITLPVMLSPKETFRCLVYDPNKKKEESSPNVNTSQWQYTMAQNFDFGRDGFVEDQNEALNWYTKAAEQGHGLSQVTLGVKYSSGGTGFAKDVVKSARWFLIAAQQNYDTAQYAIANCFLQGSGVNQDSDKAYFWFQQSADKGIDEARYRMANMLLDGYGTDEDVDRLLEWFAFFSDENRSEAQYVYSKLLLSRKPSPESESIAIEYLNRAIALYNVDAMMFLANRCFDKELNQYNVIKGMELLRMAVGLNSSEAKQMVSDFEASLSREEVFTYEKHFADFGNGDDMAKLAKMYYEGDGVARNYEEAFNYYQKASEANVEQGYIGLGLCYYYGFGIAVNYELAFKNFEKGSKSNNPVAVSGVGQCYYYGYGVEQDYEKAFELFTRSNDGTCGVALNGLGVCYYEGHPIDKNMDKALSLFEEALKLEAYNSGESLGDFYYNLYPTPDFDKAKIYYTAAAEALNHEAQNKLGLLIFTQGIIRETHAVSRNTTQTLYTMPGEQIVNEALAWFKKSSDRGNEKGEYNYAYCQIAALSESELMNSDKGKQSMKDFRALAEKGNKDAMITIASYYTMNIGVDVAEAHEWLQKAAAESTGNMQTDALYKGLLGSLEYDRAEAIAAATELSHLDVLKSSAAIMEEATSFGCTFVYDRLESYYKLILKDKKTAKEWSKRNDLITDYMKLVPKYIDFKR